MPDHTIYENPRRPSRDGETVVTTTCGHNCGGRCVVNAHVENDRIIHISTDQARWTPDMPPLQACARGVGQIDASTVRPAAISDAPRRPARLGPVRAHLVGRGDGSRLREMLRIRTQYGNAAFLDASRSGNTSPQSFTIEPYNLKFTVDRKNVTGLPTGPAAAPVRRPPAKKPASK